MKVLLITILAFVAVVQCQKGIKYKVCPKPKSTAQVGVVTITPCETQPCVLHRGGTATFQINFTPTAVTKTLKSVVKGKIGPLWVPFPLDHADACSACGVTCPLVAGQAYHFNYTLPIKTAYPAISVPVSWEFKGDNEEEVVCIEIPVKLE